MAYLIGTLILIGIPAPVKGVAALMRYDRFSAKRWLALFEITYVIAAILAYADHRIGTAAICGVTSAITGYVIIRYLNNETLKERGDARKVDRILKEILSNPSPDCEGCGQYPSNIITLIPHVDPDGVTRWYCSPACRDKGPRTH